MKRTPFQRRTPFRDRTADKANRPPLRAVSPKQVKCKVCGERYVRERALQAACSTDCAIELVKRREVETRTAAYQPKRGKLTREVREHRENDPKHVAKQAQSAVNAWVRHRDRDRPCYTCDAPPQPQRDAGHFLTRAAYSSIRYDERQIRAQCVNCNRFNSGRQREFRERLVVEIGSELVEWFEAQRGPRKWTIEELREIRDEYRGRLKDAGVPIPRTH